MKLFIFYIAIVFSNIALATDYNLKKNLIVKSAVIVGLPISNPQGLESDDGRVKHVWSIRGVQFSNFEIIGNDQNDADLIGWSCNEYDQNGNYVRPLGSGDVCKSLFETIVSHFVIESLSLTKNLLNTANQINPKSAMVDIGDFRFETDGSYYFIRRISRM